jgi:hypothetical protein
MSFTDQVMRMNFEYVTFFRVATHRFRRAEGVMP